jgi:hypothetical protein
METGRNGLNVHRVKIWRLAVDNNMSTLSRLSCMQTNLTNISTVAAAAAVIR